MGTFIDQLKEQNKFHSQLLNKKYSESEIISAIESTGFSEERAAALLSNEAGKFIESMAVKSNQITRQRFGNVINIFTPMYLNNFCINGCAYCGFNTDLSEQKRIRLTINEAVIEAKTIRDMGISQLLLVAGEDPKGVSVQYISELVKTIRPWFSSIGVEFQPFSEKDYTILKNSGVDHVAFYQETYNRNLYNTYHQRGPKKDYQKRVDNIDNIGKTGMSKIGMGILLGLWKFEEDMLKLATHINYVYKKYTFSQVVVSFPRIQHSASTEEYKSIVDKFEIPQISEKKLAQAMFVIRLLFPDAGITLSTRESHIFRDNMIPLVVTNISAASKTSPGAYSKKDEDNLDQFEIQDNRTLEEIKELLNSKNLESLMYERQYERNSE